MKSCIHFVEKNIHGAWVIYGDLGMHQYYYFTKREAMRRYREEWRQRQGQFREGCETESGVCQRIGTKLVL